MNKNSKKMKFGFWLIAVFWGMSSVFTPSTLADSATNIDVEIEMLKQQVNELDQKVRVLERQRELDKENATATARRAPRISLGTGGFNLTSAM